MAKPNWSINNFLGVAPEGLSNWKVFVNVVSNVKHYFDTAFSKNIMDRYPFYVDNGTHNSGHTPMIAPISNCALIIKLGVEPHYTGAQITYQFAHELMHLVFFSIHGIAKPRPTEYEESICSAAALCAISDLYKDQLPLYLEHVKNLQNVGYKKGYDVAVSVGFSLKKLLPLAKLATY